MLFLHRLLHPDHVIGTVIVDIEREREFHACLTCLYERPSARR